MSKLLLALTLGVGALSTTSCAGTTGYVSDGYYDGAYYSSYPSYYYGPGYYGAYRYPTYSYGYRSPYYAHRYPTYSNRGHYGGTYGHGYYGANGRPEVRPHASGTAVGSPWAARGSGHRRH